jgi:hypothetical protein
MSYLVAQALEQEEEMIERMERIEDLLRALLKSSSSTTDKKQMSVETFQKCFDIGDGKMKEWIHRDDFPAYKQGRLWYVDVEKYLVWRELEHKRSYKYAK